MTLQWLPTSEAQAQKPSAHPPGSLIAIFPTSRKAPAICWALRFDFVTDGKTTPCLYLINGNPWNQENGVVIQCNDGHLDERATVGFCSPRAKVRIDVDLESRVLARDVGYYEVGPFVAMGDFGFRLCGQDSFRTERTQVWIDCDQWVNDSATFQRAMNSSDAVFAYIPKWRVSVMLPDRDQTFCIEFSKGKVTS
jgi:hypothetical protein